MASIVAGAFQFFDGKRYDLVAFVVMPNHVHVLFRLRASHRLEEVVKSWQGFTAREINKRLGKRGELWQEGYWDRMIRNERHLFKCREYIPNPDKPEPNKKKHFVSGFYESSGSKSNDLNPDDSANPDSTINFCFFAPIQL